MRLLPQRKTRKKKMGLAPGSLVYVGDAKVDKTEISIIDYDEQRVDERILPSTEACFQFKGSATTTWINIEGVHDASVIQKIGTHFDLHPLTMEDILNTDQRPKREDVAHYIYVVLKMVYFNSKHELATEQVSLILTADCVISFQEQAQEGDVFDYVRERIRSGKGRIRKAKADYLLYALIDAVVDNYYVVLEDLGEKIEQLENDLITDPTTGMLNNLYALKRTMLSLRRSIWPLREVIGSLERDNNPLLERATLLYLQDVYGHVIQIIDTIEVLRETLSSMLDIYLSSVSNKLNTTMKFLTLVATIFMPLTFIAGVYGMNFKNMPELEWYYGYPASLVVMAVIAVGMIVFFRVKKWL